MLLLLFSCQAKKKSDPEHTTNDSIKNTSLHKDEPSLIDTIATIDTAVTPAGFIKLTEEKGDLDKDHQKEWVVVYDTGKETEYGTERHLHIYKLNGGKWTLWYQTKGAVLPSKHGGMMGDPFQGISIERSALVIHHFGGSRHKWTYTHRYRFQDSNWLLIGATINYGAPCDISKNYDYNLVTGKIEARIETDACDEEGNMQDSTKVDTFSFVRKPMKPVLMDGFYPGNNEIKVLNRDDSFYY
jgi:hypothetical protein